MSISSDENLKVRIAGDEMKAYLTILPSDDNESYTKEQLVKYLHSQKVIFGIDENALARMIRMQVYRREICVANGVEPVHGVDGVLTYKFETELNRKPQVREDGSVDYRSIHLIELVHKGDVIAVGTDPTESRDGMTVTGQKLVAKRGKPFPPLRGKGFGTSKDGHTYIAVLSGKIELVHGGVRISEVYEIDGDAGLTTGDIDFHGDVVIHGNVTPGANIKATGSIIVDGLSENCTIDAGRDIILRGGVLGGHKTKIRASGSIQAKFFEYCQIHADGMIVADSALGSQLESYEFIVLTGRKASVVGGSTYATEGIEAQTVGNSSEIKTNVQVGVKVELLRDVFNANKRKMEAEDMIAKINEGLKQFDELAAEQGKDANQDERRMALFRTRMMKQAEVATITKEIDRLQDIIQRGKGASLKVIHDIYPGVTVSIEEYTSTLKEHHSSVKFELRADNVIMRPLGETYSSRI